MLPTYLKRLSRVILIVALGLGAHIACAATFPINIQKDLHGLKIFADTTVIDVGPTITLKLSNFDQQQASCRITFDTSVEQRKTFNRDIEAGAVTIVRYSSSRPVNRLSIKLNCKPA